MELRIKELKESLEKGLVDLVDNFVQIYKKVIKDEESEGIRSKVKKLKKDLKAGGVSREKIEVIICYCESLVALEKKSKEQTQAETKPQQTEPPPFNKNS